MKQEESKLKLNYGLNLMSKPSKKKTKRGIVNTSLFAVEDEDVAENQQQELDYRARLSKRRTENSMKELLAQDPTIYLYDEIYKDMKKSSTSQRRTMKNMKGEKKKPKYIAKLMANAKRKEREREMIYVKKLHRELENEEEKYEGTESFITPEYRKKLEENKRFEEEEKRREEMDIKNRAEGKSSIDNFYFNLSKNVAFGAEPEPEEEIERGTKRKIDDAELVDVEKEEERRERRRQRAQRDYEAALKLREEQKEMKEQEIAELKAKLAKPTLDNNSIEDAKKRYLERKEELARKRREAMKQAKKDLEI
eukprot:TRINITY_DN1269_c1_g1_i5.p1 TRINITY_DN1269_c1_g1~~TRINITY_DN1269_c1_g1_i5.p1  ORF type:complete len:309 (+),score=115.14 TRINITY_DN1269_c1_g1_i5:340-1266(+)